MSEIWANRLIAGTKTWIQVPPSRKDTVREVLAGRVADGRIMAECYAKITGEPYTEQ